MLAESPSSPHVLELWSSAEMSSKELWTLEIACLQIRCCSIQRQLFGDQACGAKLLMWNFTTLPGKGSITSWEPNPWTNRVTFMTLKSRMKYDISLRPCCTVLLTALFTIISWILEQGSFFIFSSLFSNRLRLRLTGLSKFNRFVVFQGSSFRAL